MTNENEWRKILPKLFPSGISRNIYQDFFIFQYTVSIYQCQEEDFIAVKLFKYLTVEFCLHFVLIFGCHA